MAESASTLDSVAALPELATRLGRAVGLLVALHVAQTSAAHAAGFRETLPHLRANSGPRLYVCGGDRQLCALASVLCLDFHDGARWESLPPMPTARRGCATAACRGRLYVFGGHGGGRELAAVERFDPLLALWEYLPPMPTARAWCAATAVSGALFVCGGYGGRRYLAKSERYIEGTGWTPLPAMPTARSGAAATGTSRTIFVVGGFDGGSLVASVEGYSLDTGWSQLPPLPVPRCWCAVAIVAGWLYVLGGRGQDPRGWQDLVDCCRVRPGEAEWQPLPTLPAASPACVAAATPLRSKGAEIFVLGDWVDERRRPLSCRWDATDSAWQPLPPLPEIRSGFGCGALAF